MTLSGMPATGKKILIFSRDPGGANTVIPLVRPLMDHGYDVRLYGKDSALLKYSRAGLSATDIRVDIAEFTQESVARFLSALLPDIIITGTSASDQTEKFLWKAAELAGVPSFAILDIWVNYGVRFSPYGLEELDRYDANPEHSYLPRRIIAMDEQARDEMIGIGFEPERILPFGSPHFETVQQDIEKCDKKAVRNKIGCPDDMLLITFASEPISRDYENEPDGENYWGFTEQTIFPQIAAALDAAARTANKEYILLIKLHPRESDDFYAEVASSSSGRIIIAHDNLISGIEAISASDLVCGMDSMFLIEAFLAQKPVMSVMIGLKRSNTFVLNNKGLVRSILTPEKLRQRFDDFFSGVCCINPEATAMLPTRPIEEIIHEVERILWQS